MYIRKASKKIGLSPGTLVYVGEKKDQPVNISILNYDEDGVDEFIDATVDDVLNYKPSRKVIWINVSGIHDITVIEKIGKIFELHPLLLEDIVNTNHRPKIDDYDDYLFIVLKMPRAQNDDDELHIEHICVVLGRNFIISFQETEGNVFDPVRDRIKKGKGRIQKSGTDYLAYS